MGAPVSTMIGSLPRTSSELTGRYWPGPAAARLGISQVSAATGTGAVTGIWELVITRSPCCVHDGGQGRGLNRRRTSFDLPRTVGTVSGHPHDQSWPVAP